MRTAWRSLSVTSVGGAWVVAAARRRRHLREHVVHMASGVVATSSRDLTGDGKADIFTTNKHGTFLHVRTSGRR